MKFLSEYKLEIIVFVSGAVVMILEMAGSRAMAPYLGTSLFVWTGLIGVIMSSLSIGYYWGGKLADKKADYRNLSKILFFAGIAILVMNLVKSPLLFMIQMSTIDLRMGSIFGSIILFSIPSILLGVVSPYAVKLKLNSLKTSGVTVGSLYAISTAGSIFGTFLAGFFLISYLGTTNILFLLSGILFVLSLFTYSKGFIYSRTIVIVLLCLSIFVNESLSIKNKNLGFLDIDTQYNRVIIFNDIDRDTGKPIKRMNLGNQFASAMFLDNDSLVHQYHYYYNLAEYFRPDITRALIMGGAGYSYQKEFLTRYPNAKLDVVEIDPGLTDLAKKYFRLKENPNLQIFHEDARVFLNKNLTKYDVVYVDALNTNESIPFHLVTKETVQKIYDSLNNGGVVVTNTISTLSGEKGDFLESEYLTYKSIFPQVHIFPVVSSSPNVNQNIILIGLKTDKKFDLIGIGTDYEKYLSHLWTKEIPNNGLILTDDFSPVERFFKNLY